MNQTPDDHGDKAPKKTFVAPPPTNLITTPAQNIASSLLGFYKVYWDYFSLTSPPWFWPRSEDATEQLKCQNARDRFIIFLLLVDILVFIFGPTLLASAHWPETKTFLTACWASPLFGYVIWRLIDLTFVISAMAIFGGIHQVGYTSDMPSNEIHRIFLLAIVNYLEFTFLFAFVYWAIHSLSPTQFDGSKWGGHLHTDAFFVSMSTASTIGYGNIAPVKGVALVTASIQSSITLLLVAGFMAAIVSRIASEKKGSGLIADESVSGKDVFLRYVSFALCIAAATCLGSFIFHLTGFHK